MIPLGMYETCKELMLVSYIQKILIIPYSSLQKVNGRVL